ncbi:MAG: molybdopterin-synthase adenylyltransferase MoeB [Isosphaeraceae bacterium]
MTLPDFLGDRATSVQLSPAEIQRYARHLIMPEVAMAGQKRLKAAKVLCIGTGGLGSPLSLYLAAAGVGTIGLADFDVVDVSNLQRQIIHFTTDVGRPKIDSAQEKLTALNPDLIVRRHEHPVDSSNALQMFADYDIIVDGTDNFPTRYLVNDACVLLGKPNVYGSIFRFDGQATVFYPPHGPCYRCLYPEPPPPDLVPNCAEGGVLGILPGLIGVVQATETVKLILGTGTPLVGRLLLYDALEMTFREMKVRKNPRCPICGPEPTIRELIDYQEFCGVRGSEPAAAASGDGSGGEITPGELKALFDRGARPFVLDVRNPEEIAICRIAGSTVIPLPELAARLGELDPSTPMVVHCKSGVRSAKAIALLESAGFGELRNLKGGILAWIQEVDPSLPAY